MDLDDDELKATKNKFYKYNKDDFDEIFKYIKILQKIYEHCDIFDVDEFIEITNYMIDREMLIKELKDEINEMWSHIPRLD